MYRIFDGRIEQAGETGVIGGCVISNFVSYLKAIPVEVRQSYGWYSFVTENDVIEAVIDKENDTIVIPRVLINPIEEQCFNVSKIKLRHSLKEIGLWETFYNMLKTAEGDLIGEWNDAVVLSSKDPMVIGFSRQLISLGLMNTDQIKNLLNTCKSDLE